jgi:hypothetical protein
MGLGPESFHLIARQVSIVTGPQQIQFDLQLREVRQGHCKRQSGPPLDPVHGRYVNPTLGQLQGHGRGQRHC